ncbi:MAG: DUF397 domain-containing protein [Parcubacteria group bacterium]|nr:DUF397 domain-containing protein [Parcubacteria group bacterium]MCR4343082.1 DUF397 domain-containing protein [Patescibacteria group bacterium]
MGKKFMFLVSDSTFKKSSYSRIITFCVSVALTPEGVAVRDTKDHSKRTLFFTRGEWEAFVKGVKGGEFDV